MKGGRPARCAGRCKTVSRSGPRLIEERVRLQNQPRTLPGCLPHPVAQRSGLHQHITPGMEPVEHLHLADGGEIARRCPPAPDTGADAPADHLLIPCRGHPVLTENDGHGVATARDGKRMPGTQRLLQPPGIACLCAKAGKDECQDATLFPIVHDGQNASYPAPPAGPFVPADPAALRNTRSRSRRPAWRSPEKAACPPPEKP